MKRITRSLVHVAMLTVLAIVFAAVPNSMAKRPPKAKPRPSFTPPPSPTPPPAPSADLAKFVSTNGDKIFGAYSPQVPMPKAELAQLKASFSERFSKAGLADRDQYKYAMAVCDGLAQVMAEKTTVAPAAWTQRSGQLKTWIDQLMAQEKAAESAATAAPAH